MDAEQISCLLPDMYPVLDTSLEYGASYKAGITHYIIAND
jgi:hypothetical protein